MISVRNFKFLLAGVITFSKTIHKTKTQFEDVLYSLFYKPLLKTACYRGT